jgi:hypothetical protein
MMNVKSALAPLGLLGLLGLSACGVPFDPYWRVEKFRVLGVKSDPITIRPGQVGELSALAVSPSDSEITYAWDWCPFQTIAQNEYACPFTREELAELLTAQIPEDQRDQLPPGVDLAALLPEFDLGSEPTAQFAYPGTPDLVLFFCTLSERLLSAQNETLGGEAGVSQCDRGFDVTVRLIAESDGQRIIAAKQVKLWTGNDVFANRNPDVQEIQIRLKNRSDRAKVADKLPWLDEEGEDGWYTLPADSETTLVAGVPFELRSIVDPELVEEFQRPVPTGAEDDPDGLLPPEPESVTYRWFLSEGDVDDSEKLYKEGVSPQSLADASIVDFSISYDPEPVDPTFPDQQDDWDRDGTPNASDPCPWVTNQADDTCPTRVWSVVRDGRLGMDWVERRFVVPEYVAP